MGDVRRPPGPRTLPRGGATFGWARDPLAFLTKASQASAGVTRLRIAGQDVRLVCRPELAVEVSEHQLRAFAPCPAGGRPPFDEAERLLPCQAASAGWARDPALGVDGALLERLAGRISTMAHDVRAVPEDARIDALGWSRVLLRGAVLRAALGEALEAAHVLRVGAGITAALSALEVELAGLLPRFVPTRGRRGLRRLIAAVDAVLLEIVRARREGEAGGDDLLARLLAARDAEGRGLTDERIRDELLAFHVSTFEPASLALAWSIYLSGLHAEAGARLRAEARPDGAPSGFSRAVVREAMRLFPPAWLTCAEALTDVPLGDGALPAGAHVWISPWAMHRDARFFPEAEAFRPERWLGPAPTAGAFRPTVTRTIDGFVLDVAARLLEALVGEARFVPLPASGVELVPGLVLRPRHGLPMRVVPRTTGGVHDVRRLRVRRRASAGPTGVSSGSPFAF